MKAIRIHVTQEHIDNGIRDSCLQCPIALALLEALPIHDVWVHKEEISIFDATSNKVYGPNLQVRDFITRFDAGEEVEPFSFTLNDLEFKPYH